MEIEKNAERFDEAAKQYDDQRRFFIPCFDDFYKTSTTFLSEMRNDFRTILDLGAGTGLLTRYLHEQFPQPHFTLIDVSTKMLDVARKRFSGFDCFDFIIKDYSSEFPEGKFDLIASALSIHHLSDDDKLKVCGLYVSIYEIWSDNSCKVRFTI